MTANILMCIHMIFFIRLLLRESFQVEMAKIVFRQ